MGFESSDDDVILGGYSAAAAADGDAEQVGAQNPTVLQGVSSSGSGVVGQQHRVYGQGFASTLSPKSLGVTIGSLPGLSSHLSLPLSPASSSHSSLGHYGSAGGALGPHSLLGMRGYSGGSLRIPEHSLRGWLDGMS
jgi:hypothetical protein